MAEAQQPRPRRERWPLVFVLALLAGLGMLVYPLLPVTEHTATYHWDGAAPAALPLSPYRPAQLTLTVDCAAAGSSPGQLLDTVRAVDEGLQEARGRITLTDGVLSLTVRGETLTTPVPAGCAQFVVDIGTQAVTVTADRTEILRHPGDLRPAVDSLSAGPGVRGVTASVLADTQWDSSPTPAKVLVGTVSAALLAVALALAALGDRPRRRWRTPRPKLGVGDGIVLGAIVFGVIAGGATDDDGFIAQIIRTPAMSGYVGNYVRWNNAPEAPFGWFYQLYALWGEVSMEPVWLRILPALLAVAAWLVLRHGLAPRLLPTFAARTPVNRPARIALASGFTLLWLVFANSLRPEIFFALGSGVVLLCVLDALHRRSVWPLLLGALIAALTIGTGPTGLVALVPFVVAAPRLWRWLRAEPRRGLAVATVWLAALGAIVLLMFADQSFASVLSANRARSEFGPIYPIWEDYQRYWKLWWSFAARQFSVYLSAVALLYLLLRLRRSSRLPAVNRMVAAQVVGGGIGLIVVMALGPTKLPHHFGALLLLGPLAMAAGAHLLSLAQGRIAARGTALLLGGSLAVVGLAMHNNNTWWKLSTLGLLVDKKPIALGPSPVWPIVALAGLLLAVSLLWRGRPFRRAALIYALGLAIISGSQYANFAQAAVVRGPERYTMAAAARAAIFGRGCLLERSLHYEPDPARGVLPAAGRDPFTVPVTSGLLGWAADPVAADSLTTDWYALPDSVRDGQWPLVIAVSGIDEQHRVVVEFDDGTRRTLTPTKKTLATSELSDIRVHPKNTVTRFRILAESEGPSEIGFVVAQPRVPVTKPLLQLTRSETVAVAWNLAFFAPCLDTPHQGNGRVEIADYILSDSEQPGNMSYHSRSGGPFAGVIGLTEPSRVPVYAAFDYTESEMSALDLIQLVPGEAVGNPLEVELGTRVRGGLESVPPVP